MSDIVGKSVIVRAEGERVDTLRLGRMTAEQLEAIQHCELCLEPYERCQCRAGKLRRSEEPPQPPLARDPEWSDQQC